MTNVGTGAIEVRSFESPDEVRELDGKGRLLILNVAGRELAKTVFEPGWTWRDNVKPIAGTSSCEFPHFLYVLSGQLRVIMDDGSESVLQPGDVANVPPGHDAEVVGSEPCMTIDLGEEDADYGKR